MSKQLFLQQLTREMKVWEQKQLVDPESLERLRQYYDLDSALAPSDDISSGDWTRWVLYLAVFAFLAAFFSFAGSTATSLGPSLRVIVLLVGGVAGLGLGWFMHPRRRFEGVALLILGGLLLPITMFFAVHYYRLWTPQAPFLWWSAIGALLAIGFTPLARSLEEEGLAATALVNLCAIPFLWVAHAQGSLLAYPTAAVGVALGLQLLRRFLPTQDWRSFDRPMWLLGHLLTAGAMVVPIAVYRFESLWAAGIYLLATLFYLNQLLISEYVTSIPFFVVALITACASVLQVIRVKQDLYPLIYLAISSTLIAVGLVVLRHRKTVALSLLGTVFTLMSFGIIPVWFMRPSFFRSPTLLWLTISLFVAAGVVLYIVAFQRTLERMLLSYIAAWHLYLAWIFVILGWRGSPTEYYTLPLGALILLNSLWLTAPRWQEQAFTGGVLLLTMPSLLLSVKDSHATRTVFLALGGIGLISWGAILQESRKITLGALILLPAILIKIWPGLRALGVPWFVWFALFGAVLFAVAWLLQHRKGN